MPARAEIPHPHRRPEAEPAVARPPDETPCPASARPMVEGCWRGTGCCHTAPARWLVTCPQGLSHAHLAPSALTGVHQTLAQSGYFAKSPRKGTPQPSAPAALPSGARPRRGARYRRRRGGCSGAEDARARRMLGRGDSPRGRGAAAVTPPGRPGLPAAAAERRLLLRLSPLSSRRRQTVITPCRLHPRRRINVIPSFWFNSCCQGNK